MASLAGMLREKGHSVCGSDTDVYPPMSDFLDRLGIQVFKGYNPENIEKAKPEPVAKRPPRLYWPGFWTWLGVSRPFWSEVSRKISVRAFRLPMVPTS